MLICVGGRVVLYEMRVYEVFCVIINIDVDLMFFTFLIRVFKVFLFFFLDII